MSERFGKILPVTILALTGLAVSIVIESVHRQLGADVNYTSFCNVSASVNCDVVLGSRYAVLGGISVATWAILYFLAVLSVASAVAIAERATTRATLSTGLFVLAVWGLLFSLYMAGITFAVLHTVCLMCGALYLVGIGLFLTAWRLRGAMRITGRRHAVTRAGQDRLVVIGSVLAVLGLVAIGGWEALGHGAYSTDAADIARQRPDFYRWYLALPLVRLSVDAAHHARGSADAPVTVVEFSDFTCGHCAALHESLEEVLRRMGQGVRVVFRHFPLDSACNPKIPARVHPQACLAAIAAECAAEQGKFWQYHNVLFDNRQQLDRAFLIGYAAHLDLDVARFTACLGGDESRARVERDIADGAQLGIDSTPTVFINGRTIKGALDTGLLSDAVTLARSNR